MYFKSSWLDIYNPYNVQSIENHLCFALCRMSWTKSYRKLVIQGNHCYCWMTSSGFFSCSHLYLIWTWTKKKETEMYSGVYAWVIYVYFIAVVFGCIPDYWQPRPEDGGGHTSWLSWVGSPFCFIATQFMKIIQQPLPGNQVCVFLDLFPNLK